MKSNPSYTPKQYADGIVMNFLDDLVRSTDFHEWKMPSLSAEDRAKVLRQLKKMHNQIGHKHNFDFEELQ